jgi:Glyoxalase/Bleomycin resistance protein/Dioxygenase superfamily
MGGHCASAVKRCMNSSGDIMAGIKRIDHVAIAVKDVEQAVKQDIGLLNAVHVRTETLVEKAGVVKVAYMQIGENILSLVQSMEPEGFINQHIEKHGEGMHHMGLEVEKRGYKIPLRDEFSNRSEVVLRPRDANGVVWCGVTDSAVERRQ